MKVCAVSDLHGHLPRIPECDLLLIAGDLGEGRRGDWYLGPLREWLQQAPARHVVGVAGNHDFFAEENPDEMRRLPWTYLADETTEIEGLVIHGSPFSNRFGRWAFMDEEDGLERRAGLFPDVTSILVTHGPPFGFGDLTVLSGMHVGSAAFRSRALGLPELVLYVFGHIHEARGTWRQRDATWANVSYVDFAYRPYGPDILEIEL